MCNAFDDIYLHARNTIIAKGTSRLNSGAIPSDLYKNTMLSVTSAPPHRPSSLTYALWKLIA